MFHSFLSKTTFSFTFLHVVLILHSQKFFVASINLSNLDIKSSESLSKVLFISFLSRLQTKIDQNNFNEEDVRAFSFLLSEIEKRNKKVNRSNNMVYWYSRQGK